MVKRILLAVGVALLALLAVMAVRAARMPSRQAPAEAAVSIAVDADAAARHLAGAVRFRTISNERVEDTDTAAFLALHDYLAATYPLVHQTLQREPVAGLSLLYTWVGSEPSLDPIVLMAHQDVVPVVPGTEGDWLHDPFGGEITDGYVWGRGSMDDKGNLVAVLEAVEALLAQGFHPRHTVYLAFGHDEEVGGVRGASAIARLLRDRGVSRFAMVLDEGGAVVHGMIPGIQAPVALVGIAEKGYVNVELLVEGAGGHSSVPPAHTNIGVLAEAISTLEEHPFPARLDGPARSMFEWLAPEMGFGARVALANLWLTATPMTHVLLRSPETAAMVHTTTAVTIVEGGVKANVLPITARAVVNFRIMPGETGESVLERVRALIGDARVQVRLYGGDGVDPSPVSDVSGPAFQLLSRTVRQVLADQGVIVAPYLVMGGTDSKHFAASSNAVFRFFPAPMGRDALTLAHGTNERLGVDGLAISVRFFRALLRNTDAL